MRKLNPDFSVALGTYGVEGFLTLSHFRNKLCHFTYPSAPIKSCGTCIADQTQSLPSHIMTAKKPQITWLKLKPIPDQTDDQTLIGNSFYGFTISFGAASNVIRFPPSAHPNSPEAHSVRKWLDK